MVQRKQDDRDLYRLPDVDRMHEVGGTSAHKRRSGRDDEGRERSSTGRPDQDEAVRGDTDHLPQGRTNIGEAIAPDEGGPDRPGDDDHTGRAPDVAGNDTAFEGGPPPETKI